jgi:OmpA-OmpF porin, OOP family
MGDANSPPAAILPKEKIVLRDVFKCDSSRIRPASEPVLDEAIELLKNQPDMKVYVDSSCDSTRENQLNPRLSQQRATAVTTYLQRRGIAANRLISRGFDATHFVTRNNTASGRPQNHRGKLVPI